MAEALSSYDRVDHPKGHSGGWETVSAREADPRCSEDESQSEREGNGYRRPPSRSISRLAKRDSHRNLSIKTPGSVSQLGLNTDDISSRTRDGLQNGDTDESSKGHQTFEPQGHSLSSASGTTTSSSTDGRSRVSSPMSPVSPTDVSKPTVRFSDRGPPRASAKRPSMSRRSSANAMPLAEWGVLFDERGYATLRCSQFLKGLARHVIDDLASGSSSLVVTPEKLGVFYSKYRIEQEVYLFVDIFDSRVRDVYERIADFFTDLDCQYHLVQPDSYSRPRIPALTPVGFAQYMTTCILAHPDEEFKRLDKIVSDVQLVADSPGSADHQLERLPRQLLRSQFPVRHDPKSRKILKAALDDLMYDLRLLEPASPKPLAIMPPPPPPSSAERWGSGSVAGVRHYAPPEKIPSGKEAYSLFAGSETSKAHARYVPPGALQTIGDENATSSTPPSNSAAAEAMNRYRETIRRNSYHERPLSRYAEDLEVSSYEQTPASPRPHASQRQNSLDTRPSNRFSSPRTSQTGSLTITPTTTMRTYRATAYTPQSANTPTGANTPTYRRAQSPPLRTYRASAPDVSVSGGAFKPAGYLPSSSSLPDRRASMSTAADRREYVLSLASSSAADSYERNEGSRELERRRGSAGGSIDAGPTRGSVAGSKVPTPSSTTTTLVPLSSTSGSSHSRQDSGSSRRTATAPPSPAPGSGDKKHHSHRRRRSAVVTVGDDRGPTWEEVLRTQPLAHHHRSGSSSKSSGGHHHRHHSGY